MADKRCYACKKLKPRTEFYGHKSRKGDGLNGKCKECARSYEAARRLAFKESLNQSAPEEKACSLCKKILPSWEFHRSSNSRDGLNSRCRECNCLHARKWAAAFPEKARDRLLKKNFGISWEEYQTMLHRQNGACAICGGTQKTTLAVDHCHSSGRVRALLCSPCNTGLGAFRDDVDLFTKAIAYIKFHRDT